MARADVAVHNDLMLTGCIILAQATAPAAAGGSTNWLVWGIVLLAVAVALFAVEVFLPTGGIVGIASGVAAVAGIVMLFQVNTTLGLLSSLITLLSLPFLLWFALHLWPDTPFGRWVTLREEPATPASDAEASASAATPAAAEVRVGDRGRTLTPLYPVGTVLLHGRRVECLAQRGMIEADVEVQVTTLDSGQVFVGPAPAQPV